PVVVAVQGRKLRLKKQALPRDPFGRKQPQRFAHPGFVVMLRLVGRVDRAEPGPHGLLDQGRGRLLFPRRAVHEGGNRHLVIGGQSHVESFPFIRFPLRAFSRARLALSSRRRRRDACVGLVGFRRFGSIVAARINSRRRSNAVALFWSWLRDSWTLMTTIPSREIRRSRRCSSRALYRSGREEA